MPYEHEIDAPGLEARPNADGSQRWYWVASRAAKRQDYRPSAVRLHAPDGRAIDLSRPDHRDYVAQRCRTLQNEMIETISGTACKPLFDGSLGSLLTLYESGADSPFRDLREKTQRVYGEDIKRLRAASGERQLSALHRADFKRWYDAARKPKAEGKVERVRTARGLMVMLRIVLTYGAAEELPHCRRLRDVLSEMRFKAPKPRRVRPTYGQAKAVFDKARDAGCVSVALGTALQFEGMLRQYDVTGTWERLKPGEEAAIVLNGRRW